MVKIDTQKNFKKGFLKKHGLWKYCICLPVHSHLSYCSSNFDKIKKQACKNQPTSKRCQIITIFLLRRYYSSLNKIWKKKKYNQMDLIRNNHQRIGERSLKITQIWPGLSTYCSCFPFLWHNILLQMIGFFFWQQLLIDQHIKPK